jgi:hypothetical protein
MAILGAVAWVCVSTVGVRASPEVSAPAPGSPVFTTFLASFDGQSTTHFLANATSGDGSPLEYVWSLQNLSCGALVQPQARTNQNGYFHGSTQQLPEGCPYAVESLTRVTVLVARAADVDAAGAARDGAPYFTYSQVARSHDSSQSAALDPAPALHYFGVAAATSPTTVATPPAGTVPGVATATGNNSGFPLGAVIGVVALGVGGALVAFVLRRRESEDVDLVHPFVDLPPQVDPPPLPPSEVFTPPLVQTPPPAHADEGTGPDPGTGATGTAPDEDGEPETPPLIFGPRLIDLPLGEPPAVETQVEQPPLPPHEVLTPPVAPVTPPVTPVTPPVTASTPPPQQSVQHPRTKHCGPQVDDIFVEALNRVLSRLRTLFGTDPSSATGMAFLALNGGELDFWVLMPQTTCPGPHCPSTMTLCGRCYPPHLLSDIMYGFVGGYFDLETAIAVGGLAYQLTKWLGGGKEVKQPVAPAHITEAQPAYQVGVRLGRQCRDPQHAGRWRVSKEDLCAEVSTMGFQSAMLKVLLKDASQSANCPPAPCVNTAADTDWSRKRWSWDMPIDSTERWAVTGQGL